MGERDEPDWYATLGVPRGASAEEVKRAFRVLARQLHPDMHAQEWDAAERAKATEHLEAVLQAWEVLKDPERRARYDARLRELDERREREAAAAEQRRAWERARAADEYERARRASRAPASGRSPDRADGEVDYDALRAAMEEQAAYWASVLESLTRPQRGADVYCAVELDERTWRTGQRLRLPVFGVEVVIEPFVEPGWYAYRGLGGEGEFGGERGDLYLAVQHGFGRARVVHVPTPATAPARPTPSARPTPPTRPTPSARPTAPPRPTPPTRPGRRRVDRSALAGVVGWSLLTLGLAILLGVVLSRLVP